MRVLQIASGDLFSTYGGGQVYVKNVVDSMIDSGVDVKVISTLSNIAIPQRRVYRGCDLYEIHNGISKCELAEIIKEIAPDVVHAHSLKAVVCTIGSELGIPVIVTAHHGGIVCPGGARLDCQDRICEDSIHHKKCLQCVLRNIRTGLKWYPIMRHLPQKIYMKLGKFLKNKIFIPFITPIGSAAMNIEGHANSWTAIIQHASKIIAPSHRIAKVMQYNGLNADKISVIPHGIPLPSFRPEYPSIHTTPIRFYYVGRICYVKGLHVMLEAIRLLQDKNIELHIFGGAGNKQETKYMRHLKIKYADDSRIVWHGKVSPNEIFKQTSTYHVMIAPTIYLEIFGLNIAEALSLGKPVITTASGGGEMQIIDGINGWIITPNRIDVLVAKIEEILARPQQLIEMSGNCKSISMAEHCKALLDVYKEVV